MAMTTMTIRIDNTLKKEASSVADYYGLDLSSVTRAFYKQMVNTGSIPLDFTPDIPNEETRKAIAEGDAFFKSGKAGRFTSGADLIKDAVSR